MVEKEEVEIDYSQVRKMTANGLDVIEYEDIKKGCQIVVFNFRNHKIVEIRKFCAMSDCVDGKVSSGIRAVRMSSEGHVYEDPLPSEFSIDCTKVTNET